MPALVSPPVSPPRRASRHGDRSVGRRLSDPLPARVVRAATAATASRATPGQAGGRTDPESGIESHLRRRPALREGTGARRRLASQHDAIPRLEDVAVQTYVWPHSMTPFPGLKRLLA